MNNSIIKLEDFELDEISGGITAKQVAKKTAGYAIKGLSTVVFATVDFAAVSMVNSEYFLKHKEFIQIFFAATSSLLGIAGWKLGELICKKIGLED